MNGRRQRTVALTKPRRNSSRRKQPFDSSEPRKAVPHKELELILMRQLGDCLAMPIFIVNVDGTLLFYNEPAEVLLGQRFEETGELTAHQWANAFVPTDDHNRRLPAEKLPLVIALRERRPAHAEFSIRGLDQISRRIEVTALPLVGRANRFVGAVAIFWEVPKR